jgi:hypothetical protein
MSLQIEPAEFVGRFLSLNEGSNMFYSKSCEFAQMFALLLNELDEADKIQKMKNNVSEEINIDLLRVESDVYKWYGLPDKKVRYIFKDGSVKSFTIDELSKALKRVWLTCSGIVSQLVVRHKIQFDVKLHVPTKRSAGLKTDFAKPTKQANQMG